MENENVDVPAEQSQIENSESVAVKDAEAVLKKNQELLKELAELKRKTRQYDGIDPEKARQAMEALADLEQEKMIRKGEFEKALENRTKAYESKLEAVTKEKQQIINSLTGERLRNHLISAGVIPTKVELAARYVERDVELVSTENGLQLRKIGGIGDSAEFDEMVKELLTSYPDLVASDLITGSGSPPVKDGAGATGRKWSELTQREKTAAIREAGGDIETARSKYK